MLDGNVSNSFKMIFFSVDQMKLQQQKLHLGPPPLLLPIKRHEDLGGSSGDDGLPCSPSEVSNSEELYMNISNKVLQL